MSLTPSQLTSAPDWLLSVTLGGRVYRWTSAPEGLDVTAADGTVYTFESGLDAVELSEVLSGPGGEPDEMSIPFRSLYWPDDLAQLEHRGHRLDSATAEVALMPRGGSYEDRLVVLDGNVVQPEVGSADEPVAFSVEAFPWDDQTLYPPTTWVVSLNTWSQAAGFELPDDSVGEVYPTVIGSPGWLSRVPSITTSGSPGIVVEYHTASAENRKLLIAGHRVGATSVIVFFDGGNATLNVTHEEDDLGQVVATVALGSGGGAINTSTEYWIGWNSTGGGMLLSGGTVAMDGAGDICEWALENTDRKVDRGRWRTARAFLNRYRLGGYIAGERVNLWQWLTENITPLLPVSVHNGPGGLFPYVWRAPLAADCVAHLIEGENVTRTSRKQHEPMDDVVNEVRLQHGKRAKTGGYRAFTVARGGGSIAAGEIDSYLATLSLNAFGSRAVELNTDWVYGDDVAELICTDMIEARWAPGYTVTMEAGSELASIPKGAPVLWTDDGLYASALPVTVVERAWIDEESIEITIRVHPRPLRDTRV